jgi:hypothetical protein
MKTITLLLAVCFLMPLYSEAQESPDYIIVNGVIKEQRTNENLAYVSVRYLEQNIGTVTNADGEFTIRIKRKDGEKGRLEFSSVGYNSLIVPVYGRTIKDTTIYLTPVIVVLNPITIYANDPEAIVRQAIYRIKDNYSSETSLYSGFYRETIKKRTNYVSISEAVVNIYKTPYTRGVEADRVYIEKGRQIADYSRYDTMLVQYRGGPYIPVLLDVAKNNDLFLVDIDVPLYNYTLEQLTMIDDRPHFTIKFSPKSAKLESPFHGIMYIDQENLTFSQVEFNLSMENKKLATEIILQKKPLFMRFTPEEVSYLCVYKQHNGRSYLHYVRNELRFKCDWRRKLFSSRYTVVAEAVVTGVKPITELPSDKSSFTRNQIFTDNVRIFYDEEAWKNYNIIDPTESLRFAVDKLLKKQ